MELSWECCSQDLIFPGLAVTASAWRQKVSFCLSQVYIPLEGGDKFNPCPRCPQRLISITACKEPEYLEITEGLGVAVVGDITSGGLSQSLPNWKNLGCHKWRFCSTGRMKRKHEKSSASGEIFHRVIQRCHVYILKCHTGIFFSL